MLKWLVFLTIVFISGVTLAGCANQRDLVSESIDRRNADRDLSIKMMSLEYKQEDQKNFLVRQLESMDSRLKSLELSLHPEPLDEEDEFDKLSEEAARKTDLQFCMKGKRQQNDFLIGAFCKKGVR